MTTILERVLFGKIITKVTHLYKCMKKKTFMNGLCQINTLNFDVLFWVLKFYLFFNIHTPWCSIEFKRYTCGKKPLIAKLSHEHYIPRERERHTLADYGMNELMNDSSNLSLIYKLFFFTIIKFIIKSHIHNLASSLINLFQFEFIQYSFDQSWMSLTFSSNSIKILKFSVRIQLNYKIII